MNNLTNYAKNLPLEVKIQILIHLPYKDVMFITYRYFWIKYWNNYNSKYYIEEGKFKPNPEQEYVLELIESGKNIFINSPAGTGKSALIKYFYSKISSSTLVGLTSTTGISALNIGGSTLHSFLGIGLGIEDVVDLYNKIMKNRDKRELWLNIKILIIDEISMMHPDLFDKLEKLARKIRENKFKFGGIQLVVTGDLFQLPCISQNSTLITSSSKFRKSIDNVIELRNIIRQSDHKFKTILNKIRIGEIDEQVKYILKTRFIKPPKTLIKPTKLFCTRKSVDHLNNRELTKLDKKGNQFREYVMQFIDSGCPISFEYITKNFIKNSPTPSILCLAQNVQVMLTYNISSKLVNGSRGVITGFTPENYPIVEFVNGIIDVIKPTKFKLHHTLRNGKIKLVGYAVQIPLKIAYAVTIHACQGLTLDYVSIDLRETFEYGQAYTALSRVRTLDGLFLKKFDFNVIKSHPEAIKYV